MGTVTAPRACGNCTACCTVLGVKPLGKQPGHRCAHLSTKGCRIYATRPGPCIYYECSWLTGLGTRHDRPDRLGVILDQAAPANADDLLARAEAGEAEAAAAIAAARKTITAREVRPGAFHTEPVKRWLEWLHREGFTVRLIPFAGRRLPVGRAL